MNALINIQDDIIRLANAKVLDRLLIDKSTKKNIMWGTDTYASFGKAYERNEEIKSHLISGENTGLIKTRARKVFEQQSARTKQHAEVFTPLWVCKKMNDYADEVWFGRTGVFDNTEEKLAIPKRKKWQHYVDHRRLEITCGEAPYLVSRYDVSTAEMIPIEKRIGILDRKLRIVNENTETEEEWIKWVFRAFEATYGYEFQGDNLLIARVNFMMSFVEYLEQRWHREPTEKEYLMLANRISWNLWQMDGLSGTLPYCKAEEEFEQTDMFTMMGFEDEEPERQPLCKIYDWRRENSLLYKNVNTGGRNMKFDFIIGNPPYQEETLGDNKAFAPPVYHQFMDEAYSVADKVELIHPARFLFNAGSTPKAWNQKMLNDEHFRVLHYEQDSSKLFTNTSIMGGIVISYHDNCHKYKPIEVFSQFDELNSVRIKTSEHQAFRTLSNIVYSAYSHHLTNDLYKEHPDMTGRLSKGHSYDLKTNILELMPEIFTEGEKDNTYIKVLGRKDGKRVMLNVKSHYITGPENLFKYKVFLAGADGAAGTMGNPIPARIIGVPVIGMAGCGSTESFLSIGSFDTLIEAENTQKYIKTKFARALLGILKVTQNITPEKWKYVPLQDFTPESDIDWSKSIPEIDQQLYAKYGLSKEEIDFIETHVKEMS